MACGTRKLGGAVRLDSSCKTAPSHHLGRIHPHVLSSLPQVLIGNGVTGGPEVVLGG